MSIIDCCFHNSESFGVSLLKQRAVMFDNMKPLELAEEADCRIFLASECVQRYLDHKWSFLFLLKQMYSFTLILRISGLVILIIKY